MSEQNPTSDLAKKLAELRREGEERQAAQRAQASGLSYVDLRKTPVSLDAVGAVPEAEAKEALLVPLERKQHKLALAVRDPSSPEVRRVVEELVAKHYEVTLFVASLSGITKSWELYRFIRGEKEAITGKVTLRDARIAELLKTFSTLEAVTHEIGRSDFEKLDAGELLELMLAGALGVRASDIHLEAEEGRAKIRFRVDGALYDISEALPVKQQRALISRIKLVSRLKLNVTDEPQDGRFTVTLGSREVEVRVSVIPSEFGETAVLRVLDPEAIHIGMAGLGMRKDDLAIAERALAAPNGLILNTGPTGSGKTTTLYAFLRHVNKPDIKIITVEDPIEYHLPGIEQTQTDAAAGYTFASGLRSILRQDPDVILVGEVRDRETADIALQAALTGHIVLTTLHTNDAIGAVPRLIDLGVRVQTIGPALTLVIAQRLVRALCMACRRPVALQPDLKEKIAAFLRALPKRATRSAAERPTLYEAGGCPECSGIGYKGRIGVFELLETGLEFEKVILKEPSEVALREFAKRQSMVTMQQDGILKALQGITTFQEVETVTGPIAW
jgi:type II secretory ATPase GspE/PulE/Tfp pilus assembly ATPase PilB-like protein